MTLRKSYLNAEPVEACSHLPARSPRCNSTTPYILILLDKSKSKVKIKAMEAQRGSRGITLLFL